MAKNFRVLDPDPTTSDTLDIPQAEGLDRGEFQSKLIATERHLTRMWRQDGSWADLPTANLQHYLDKGMVTTFIPEPETLSTPCPVCGNEVKLPPAINYADPEAALDMQKLLHLRAKHRTSMLAFVKPEQYPLIAALKL